MPIGNEVGSFASTATSMTKGVTESGAHTFTMNVEGEVSGGWSGAVLGTITAKSSDFKVGTYTATFAAYLADGSVVSGDGSGTLGATGGHKWQLNGVALLSDGSRVATEGVLELSSRTYNGTMYEIT